jgi:hypothetical protein
LQLQKHPARFSASDVFREGAENGTHGVQTHIAHYATASTGPWTQGYVDKKSICTIGTLPSGVEHWFRVQAIGAAGPSDWSGPISKRAT